VAVVLTHAAEGFHLFPNMGWGLPNSVGHYLGLGSAILWLVLFLLGMIVNVLFSAEISK
jgi:hypothetical protein